MIGYFSAWLVLVFSAMPVGFALGVIAVAWLILEQGSLIGAPQRLIAGIDNFPLLAVPFFILAGNLMNTGGVSERIFAFARTLCGHITGGLAHVNVVGSVIFSGMSGSAVADAGGLGALEIKAMREEGFEPEFAGAITCASCIIGPLIPPSIPMVIYGVTANASIGALFLGGVTPGLLTAAALMVMIYVIAKKRGYPRYPRATFRELARAFWRASLALLTPVIIMAGIFGGIFTPTEAAAVAAMYSLILGVFIYREMGPAHVVRVFKESMNTSAVVGFIVAAATLFNWVLTRERVPQIVAETLLGISSEPWVMLLIINLLLLFLGMLMEALAILILLVPVLMPITQQLGIDPVHFGVVVVFNLMIGLLTPPMGIGLFVVSKVGNIPLANLTRATMPFLVPLVIVLFLITYIPGLVMWLPNLVIDR